MLERLNDALAHIEAQLEGHIDVAELAQIAMTSEYHFRRMFSGLAGMPLSEYVRRRRLTVAAAEVIADREPLLDIAVRHGYGSGEAFARAFRSVHGVGPGEVRRTGAALRSQPRMSFRLIVEGNSSMRYRIVEKGEFKLAGKKARVPLVYEGVNPSIAEFIRSIDKGTNERITALSDQEPRGLLSAVASIAEDRAEGSELDYYHSVVTDAEVPDDLDSLTVSPGTWAVFESSGPFPQALQEMWRDIYTQWFPSNPYRSIRGPELVRTEYLADGEHADAQVWIAVERETR